MQYHAIYNNQIYIYNQYKLAITHIGCTYLHMHMHACNMNVQKIASKTFNSFMLMQK